MDKISAVMVYDNSESSIPDSLVIVSGVDTEELEAVLEGSEHMSTLFAVTKALDAAGLAYKIQTKAVLVDCYNGLGIWGFETTEPVESSLDRDDYEDEDGEE